MKRRKKFGVQDFFWFLSVSQQCLNYNSWTELPCWIEDYILICSTYFDQCITFLSSDITDVNAKFHLGNYFKSGWAQCMGSSHAIQSPPGRPSSVGSFLCIKMPLPHEYLTFEGKVGSFITPIGPKNSRSNSKSARLGLWAFSSMHRQKSVQLLHRP